MAPPALCAAARLARPALDAAVRALALLAAGNLLLGLLAPRLDANWLWVSGGWPPDVLDAVLAGFAVAVLAGRRIHPRLGPRVAAVFALVLAVACAADVIGYYRLVVSGSVRTACPVPLSVCVAALLGLWGCLAAGVAGGGARAAAGRPLAATLATGTALLLLGLGTVVGVGATDYRRPADAIAVFGAAVRADGAPSGALRDRTLTACALYHEGLADTLVLTGGRDPRAPLSEPACMARICLEEGVPARALVLDAQGANTRRSVLGLEDLAAARGWRRLLVVSHDYHLARIHLVARRRGLAVFGVPAVETVRWPGKPSCVLREVLALGWYVATGPV